MAFKWRRRHSFGLIIAVSLFIFLVALLADRIFHRVGTGEVGVLYLYFWGTEQERTYAEGITITFPWNEIFIYTVREQQYSDEVVVLSYNGLSIRVAFSFRFQLVPEKVGVLHVLLGPDYLEKVIKPTLFASVREVVGNYRPEELFTTHSATLQDEIRVVAQQSIENYYIRFSEILVKSIVLPPKVENAIQDKLVLQQVAEGYDFRLVSEERERLRKQIESDGIRVFLDTVSKSLDKKLLTYLQIRAMETLATSPNAKLLVLGNQQDGNLMVPIMMNDLESTATDKSAGSSVSVLDTATNEANQSRDHSAPTTTGDQSATATSTSTSSAPLLMEPSTTGPGGNQKQQRDSASGSGTPASTLTSQSEPVSGSESTAGIQPTELGTVGPASNSKRTTSAGPAPLAKPR